MHHRQTFIVIQCFQIPPGICNSGRTRLHCSRHRKEETTFSGMLHFRLRQWRFSNLNRLVVEQQPDRARMCGFGDKVRVVAPWHKWYTESSTLCRIGDLLHLRLV